MKLAAKYIRRQTRTLAKQLACIRIADDIEVVHRARVATRRLRAALKLFRDGFSQKKVRRWRKSLRRLANSLGAARDRDVQLEFLHKLLANPVAPECLPGIARIMVQLERERERLQSKVISAAERLGSDGTLRAMRREARRILGTKKNSVEPSQASGGDVLKTNGETSSPNMEATPEVANFGKLERCLLRRMESLRAFQACLNDSTDCRRHHAMRIAAKRLRYTLEILRPLCGNRLEESVEAMRNMQTMLGDIHDCDVWADHLASFAAEEYDRLLTLFGHAGRYSRLQPGIAFLQENRLECRRNTFERLGRFWAELENRQFWNQLSTIIQRGISE